MLKFIFLLAPLLFAAPTGTGAIKEISNESTMFDHAVSFIAQGFAIHISNDRQRLGETLFNGPKPIKSSFASLARK